MDILINPVVKKIGPAHFKAGMKVQGDSTNEVMLKPRYYVESAAQQAALKLVDFTINQAKSEGRIVEINPNGEPYAKVFAAVAASTQAP